MLSQLLPLIDPPPIFEQTFPPFTLEFISLETPPNKPFSYTPCASGDHRDSAQVLESISRKLDLMRARRLAGAEPYDSDAEIGPP